MGELQLREGELQLYVRGAARWVPGLNLGFLAFKKMVGDSLLCRDEHTRSDLR
jgi:hypothetical protein